MTEAAVFSFAEQVENTAEENDAAIASWSHGLLMLMENMAMPELEESEGTAEETLKKELPDFPPHLKSLSAYARLDLFECKVLMICVLAQVDSEIVQFAREMQGIEDGFSPITVALLLTLFDEGTHSHFVADAPLSKNGFVTVSGEVLYEARIQIDPAVLSYLLTGNLYEPTFSGIVQSLSSRHSFCKTHRTLLDQATDILNNGTAVLQLVGRDRQSILDIAAAAAHNVSWKANLISVLSLPSDLQDLMDFTQRWRRFAALQKKLLVIDATAMTALDKDFVSISHHLRRFIDHSRCTVILLVKEPLNFEFSSSANLRVLMPERHELEEFWVTALYHTRCRLVMDAQAEDAIIEIDDSEDKILAAELASSFAFSPSDIESTVLNFQTRQVHKYEESRDLDLLLAKRWREDWWEAARHAAQPDFGGLARLVFAQADFKTLVTDQHTEKILQQIISQFKKRAIVREKWGLEPAFQRGNGITVLLAGESGTGKSLTAEVIANALSLDLYQIDLSQLVSKYIGETQKNLSRIFEAAEKGGAVLLFDEADALFSKRTDVKDARDRHANMEVGFLLQRMEEYSGIAILTTNLKENLDDAFLRRLQFVVDFSFPNTKLRARLWQTLLPKPALKNASLPKPEILAKLTLSGAQIRNVIRRAVYYAAAGEGELDLQSLLSATQAEMEKSDRALTEKDLRDLLSC